MLKFQLPICYSFGEKIWTSSPPKNKKNRDFSKPEVTSSKQKKVYKIFIFIYQS